MKAISQILLAITILTLAIFAVLWLIYKWKDDKRKDDDDRKRRELLELNKKATSHYVYLRNFLYLILTPHFCHLTGLAQPLTANNLTDNPPFEPDADTGTMFFFFKVGKENLESLLKGTSHVANLLLSVLSQKMETTGIEGICSAISNPLCTVISIHAVEGLGSHIRITLVFDNEAYQKFREKSGVPGSTSLNLVEHIR